MSLQSLVTRDVLFAYFAGQATVLQKQMIEKWIEEEPENEEFFYLCLHQWEMKHLQYDADTNTAIDKFNENILKQNRSSLQPEIEQTNTLTTKKSTKWQKWFVAASVLFILQSGAWLFHDNILYKSYSTSYGQTNSITLADGSRVVLNANSVLKVPRFGFGELSRCVHLKGEARFSVVHTPDDKKFIVLTDSVFQVEVLGTEFNLFARKSGTKVVLQEGSVKVLYKEENKPVSAPLLMAPGDVVTVDKKQNKLQIKKVQHPENYSAWQHGRFVFDKTSLIEIKDVLQESYGLIVELKGINISEKTVSGSFKAKDANELLSALSMILDINVIRYDNQVILKGRN